MLLQQLTGQLQVPGGHCLQHLQLPVGVATHRAQDGGGFNAPQPAGVGHGHAPDVFDDVSAAPEANAPGHLAQNLPGFCGGIGDGDGLGAAQRGDQLPLQRLEKDIVLLLCHASTSLSYFVGDSIAQEWENSNGRQWEGNFPPAGILKKS